MLRETSAGGLVLRHMQNKWWVAVIEPGREGEPDDRKDAVALPKGNVDGDEQPLEAAVREVLKEMRHEVRRAYWIPLSQAPARLRYNGERQVAKKALEYIKSHREEF